MKRTISILMGIMTLWSCRPSAADKNDNGSAHSHEETASVTSLTPEQFNSVGIILGSMEQKQLTSTVRANGLLRVPNNNKGIATALFGGVIKTLNVEIGSFVRKGQLIATIANPQFIRLQEEYLTVKNQITLAEQDVQRQQELVEGNAGARKNLQAALSELNTLRTRRSSLHEQIGMMGINPDELSNSSLKSALAITSPVTGTVSNVFSKIGSYADVSSPIAEIVDNSSLHLDLQIFEKDLPEMKVGQTIHFTLTNNPRESYTARVFNIGSSFENESKTIAVHCNVIGNKKGLIDGMNVSAIVSLDDVTGTAVLNDAIVEADGRYYIFVQTDKEAEDAHDHSHGDDKEHVAGVKARQLNFEKIEVVKGVSDMGYTAITPVTDLPEETKVVIKGAFFIHAKMSNARGHSH